MANFDWATAEQGLARIVATAGGFSAGKVIWEGQTATRPALPYVSLSRSNEECLSFTAEQVVSANPHGHGGDEHATPPVIGTELLIDYYVDTEFHLRVQVFTAEVIGNNAAPAVLSRLHNYFDTDAALQALEAIGLVCVERASVVNLTGLVETKFEGRASLDIRMRTGDGGQEAVTYIGSVELTPKINGVTGTPFVVDTEPEE